MDTGEQEAQGRTETKLEKLKAISPRISEAFPQTPPPVTGEVNRHSNDLGLFEVWKDVSQDLRQREEEAGYIRTGIVVGSGGCPSTFAELLPEVDVLLFTDIDQRALDWVKHTVESLEKYPSSFKYEAKVYDKNNPLLQGRHTNPGATTYIAERQSLKDFHLLSSEERYRKNRAAFLQAKTVGKQILYVPIDLGDSAEGRKLTDALGSENRIVYANLTNVAFHVIANGISAHERFSLDETTRGYRETLRRLPFDNESIVQYSLITDRRSLPQAKYTRGVDQYLKDALVMPPA